jgi:hypothetical protein
LLHHNRETATSHCSLEHSIAWVEAVRPQPWKINGPASADAGRAELNGPGMRGTGATKPFQDIDCLSP